MPNYQNAKVYKIVSGDLCYIGSTCFSIKHRLGEHIRKYNCYLNGNYNYVTSFKVIENGNYTIELVEDCPCITKEELHAREKYHIKNSECVNKLVAGRNAKERYQDNKEKIKKYYQYNKDKLSQSFECSCGGHYILYNKSRHLKTKTHINNVIDV